MRRAYPVLGWALVALFLVAELTGWERAAATERSQIPSGARNQGGYRSFHFWTGGK